VVVSVGDQPAVRGPGPQFAQVLSCAVAVGFYLLADVEVVEGLPVAGGQQRADVPDALSVGSAVKAPQDDDRLAVDPFSLMIGGGEAGLASELQRDVLQRMTSQSSLVGLGNFAIAGRPSVPMTCALGRAPPSDEPPRSNSRSCWPVGSSRSSASAAFRAAAAPGRPCPRSPGTRRRQDGGSAARLGAYRRARRAGSQLRRTSEPCVAPHEPTPPLSAQ
jgi:hypothetical protein